MRKYVVAAVVCLAMLAGIAEAQMRGFSGGFRGGFPFGGSRSRIAVNGRWQQAPPRFDGQRAFGFGNFGRFSAVCTPFAGCFRPAVFGVPFSGTHFGHHHNGTFFGANFGFGTDFGTGFGSAFGSGFPAWGGGYGTPYYFDQASYDQDESTQAQSADRQRMLDEVNFERRRAMELERQYAELQAAQETSEQATQQQATQNAPSQSASGARPMPAILVFRDGRQMQVENYVITPNRLFSLGPDERRTIQLSELDLEATIKANQDRGVSFSVPKSK